MATLILLRGYSGSGKTTIAREWVAEAPENRVRVNRDDLRASLFFSEGVLSREQEQIVTKVQREAALAALKSGRHVIVDDTNLVAKFAKDWADFAATNGFNFMVQDHVVDVETCLRRNAQRVYMGGRGVPAEVIINQQARFPYPWPVINPRATQGLKIEPVKWVEGAKEIILCDIDGTIAHMNGRSPYDWSRVGEDLRDQNIIDLVNIIYLQGYDVIFFSGRDSVCREKTREWLHKHTGHYPADNRLFMRPQGDNRKDSIIKLELFNEHIRGNYNVKYVLDDRKQVVEMWRALGLTVLAVADGDF